FRASRDKPQDQHAIQTRPGGVQRSALIDCYAPLGLSLFGSFTWGLACPPEADGAQPPGYGLSRLRRGENTEPCASCSGAR
ncbi:MAG: hypothetical protein KJ052_03845, partial [Candidatus Hydrogenedentes bacterium]|nr:hypothetical protein [Candidatus Hydrogenedentota bacterium]